MQKSVRLLLTDPGEFVRGAARCYGQKNMAACRLKLRAVRFCLYSDQKPPAEFAYMSALEVHKVQRDCRGSRLWGKGDCLRYAVLLLVRGQEKTLQAPFISPLVYFPGGVD